MKKILSIFLLLSLILSLTACGEAETELKEISCDDIIKAYGDAGYHVTHGEHKSEANSSQLCYVKASLSDEPDSDYVYFITCFTEEQAKEALKIDEYNIIVWLFAAVSGESRWLKTGTYGTIEYSYYNDELIKPFEDLVGDTEDSKTDGSEENTGGVSDANNIKSINFYAYYGGGNGSAVPTENMEEIVRWLRSFALGEKAEDEMLPPGTNTYHVEIEYEDGTVIKYGLDAVQVDGALYYVKRDPPPACFYEIISKTSID